jgi:hypothetical protein
MKTKDTLQISLKQAQKLVAFFGGENTDVTIGYRRGSMYAYCTEYPEEGAVSLGRFDPDSPAPGASSSEG